MKHAFNAPADVRLAQAVLGDVLVEQTRSSLIMHIHRDADSDSEDEDDDEEKETEGEVETVTLANLIPGVVCSPHLNIES